MAANPRRMPHLARQPRQHVIQASAARDVADVIKNGPASEPEPDPEPILSTPATKATEARLRVFLEHYQNSGRLYAACRVAGISPMLHYRKLKEDPAYREAFELAERQIGDELEASAIEQAKAGNSSLMIVLLRRFLPDEYRNTSARVEVNIDLAERIEAGRRRVIEMQGEYSGEERIA